MKHTSLLIHPDELSKDWIDRVADLALPTLALHPGGGKGAEKNIEDLLSRLQTPEYISLLDDAAEKGISIEYEMHAARFLLPTDQFEAHPEWFRMNAKGERTPDWNCCVSNTEALDFMAERAAKLVQKFYHSTHRYFLWMDDAKDSYCHCPACRDLSPSDQQLLVMNRLVRRLRQDDPEASLAYLAYFECIAPPTKVQAEEGIFLEYAPFERDFHKPLSEDAQSEPLEKLLAFFGRKSAKALDYWYDNSMFSSWKKPPKPFAVDEPVLRADFAYYRALGFEDIGCFACYLGKDYEELHGTPDLAPYAKIYHN